MPQALQTLPRRHEPVYRDLYIADDIADIRRSMETLLAGYRMALSALGDIQDPETADAATAAIRELPAPLYDAIRGLIAALRKREEDGYGTTDTADRLSADLEAFYSEHAH